MVKVPFIQFYEKCFFIWSICHELPFRQTQNDLPFIPKCLSVCQFLLLDFNDFKPGSMYWWQSTTRLEYVMDFQMIFSSLQFFQLIKVLDFDCHFHFVTLFVLREISLSTSTVSVFQPFYRRGARTPQSNSKEIAGTKTNCCVPSRLPCLCRLQPTAN